jgi:ferrous iron transport protein B
VIFTATVVIWVLGYFPNHGENLQTSWLGGLGQWIEPVFEPIGLDWRYGVAILMSFLAREVFVGTLGTMFGIESADENVDGLASQISASGLTLASGLSLIVFYAIALQCVSTVAVLRKELGQWRTPLLVTLGYGVLAYAMALATFWLFSY